MDSPPPVPAPDSLTPSPRPYNPALRGDSLYALRTAQKHLQTLNFERGEVKLKIAPEDGYRYRSVPMPSWVHETVADLLVKAYELGSTGRPFDIID